MKQILTELLYFMSTETPRIFQLYVETTLCGAGYFQHSSQSITEPKEFQAVKSATIFILSIK